MYNSQYFKETSSTNFLMKEILLSEKHEEGFMIYTDFQTAGKGQGLNTWESEFGKNLLFSIVLYPQHIHPSSQFVISQIASLAICDVLSEICDNVKIKWPNDIYVDDKKIAGILIENVLQGKSINRTVIGIGLNVNQKNFVSDAPNPVSLMQITGKRINRLKLMEKIREKITELYNIDDYDKIKSEYFRCLYRNNGFYPYSTGVTNFEARITDVLDDGRILLKLSDGNENLYGFKEVEFIINS